MGVYWNPIGKASPRLIRSYLGVISDGLIIVLIFFLLQSFNDVGQCLFKRILACLIFFFQYHMKLMTGDP